MRRFLLACISASFLLTSCNGAKKLGDTNFAVAINQYLFDMARRTLQSTGTFQLMFPAYSRQISTGSGLSWLL